jgi:hypothetical protein
MYMPIASGKNGKDELMLHATLSCAGVLVEKMSPVFASSKTVDRNCPARTAADV